MLFIPPLGGIFYFCSMRTNNQQSIKEVIEQFLKESKLDSGIAVTQLYSVWESIVGFDLSKQTTKLEIKNSRLMVHLESSVARSEMHFLRASIIEKVNAYFAKTVVESIILL
jgi:hypothetical protein